MVSRPFAGFSTRRDRSVSLPPELFTEILAEIQDLAELKALLTIFRQVAAQRDTPRAVSREDLRGDKALRQGLAVLGPEQPPEERLDRALERCVARGTLLHLVARSDDRTRHWYMLNTAANRRLVKEMGEELGRHIDTSAAPPDEVVLERPTIYRLYEQNIGLITPLLAEELEEAAQRYPPDWLGEAFREAVAHNHRNWRYVQAILERWAREGRGERPGRREAPIDIEKYTRGKYAHLFGEGPDEQETSASREPDEAD